MSEPRGDEEAAEAHQADGNLGGVLGAADQLRGEVLEESCFFSHAALRHNEDLSSLSLLVPRGN